MQDACSSVPGAWRRPLRPFSSAIQAGCLNEGGRCARSAGPDISGPADSVAACVEALAVRDVRDLCLRRNPGPTFEAVVHRLVREIRHTGVLPALAVVVVNPEVLRLTERWSTRSHWPRLPIPVAVEVEGAAPECRVVVRAERLSRVKGTVVTEGKPLPNAAKTDDVRAEESGLEESGLVVAIERHRSLVLRLVAVVRARNRRRYRRDGERRRSRSQKKKTSA